MKNLAFAFSFAFLVSSLAACHKSGGPPPEPTGTESPEASGEATGGEGSPAGGATGTMACQSGDDCVVSCARPSQCCDQLCPPCEQVFNKDALAALETWKSQNCAAVSCPVAKCMAPKEQTAAICKNDLCVLERTPATN